MLIDELIKVVRGLAASDPDFEYEVVQSGDEIGCHYVRNGAPSCLMGRALYEVGVPVTELAQHEGKDVSDVVKDLCGERDPMDKSYLRKGFWLNRVQNRQDHGERWGDCIESADRMYPEVGSNEAR